MARLVVVTVSALMLLTTPAHAQLHASVLPPMRNVLVGQPASAFATIINAGATTATGCSIAPITNLPATFTYQTTDPQTNLPVGIRDTPVDIPAGGAQTFVIALTPTGVIGSIIPPKVVEFSFACTNTNPAAILVDINTLTLRARRTADVADILAIAVTPSHNGIVNVPLAATSAFAVAAANAGGFGSDMVRVSGPAGIVATVCRTDPLGACLAAPEPQIMSGASRTFSVFVTASSPVAFDPVENRVFVWFTANYPLVGTVTFGYTSVAVRTEP